MNIAEKNMDTIKAIMSEREQPYPSRWVNKEVTAIINKAEKYAPNQVSIFRATCVRPETLRAWKKGKIPTNKKLWRKLCHFVLTMRAGEMTFEMYVHLNIPELQKYVSKTKIAKKSMLAKPNQKACDLVDFETND